MQMVRVLPRKAGLMSDGDAEMLIDHSGQESATPRAEPRRDSLALRWESATGEGRILARGAEALTLYQSDLGDAFRGLRGGFMVLGRIQTDGSFRAMIRQTFQGLTDPVRITAVPVERAESDPAIIVILAEPRVLDAAVMTGSREQDQDDEISDQANAESEAD